MTKQQVWWKTFKSLMSPNWRYIKCKQVFKIKCNRQYHTKLVACGCSQVPGINYFKNYLPIMNNVTFGILLLIMIHLGLLIEVVDVKIAFWCGKLKEEFYMECPPVQNALEKMTASCWATVSMTSLKQQDSVIKKL